MRHPLHPLTFAIAILGAVLLAGPARSQDEGDARELRRIVHLRSGQTVRGVTRFADGRWEYRGKAGWRQIEPSFVVRTELESEVLGSWREKKGATPPGNLDLRVQLADWALSAGLVQEGLDEMSNVLGFEPDHPAALESLREHSNVMSVPPITVPPSQLPEAKQNLMRFGASIPSAARELAVLELGKLPRDEILRDELLAELRSRVDSRRSFAALALRRLLPGDGIKPILMHAVLDPSAEVRNASSLALRAAGEPGLILPLVRVIEKSQSAELRMRSAEALGNMGYKAAVQPLVARLASAQSDAGSPGRIPHANIFVGRQFAYIQDFDVEVAQFQAVADPQINVLIEGSALDAAVTGAQDMNVAVEVAAVRASLERLTGESPGKSSQAWLAWWEKNGSKWRSEELSRPQTEGAGTAGG
ncbi:MAG: HEAT repeat domain-containing protein [Planctomycetota bacterium]